MSVDNSLGSFHPDLSSGPVMDTLLHIVDNTLADATARAGPHLACRPGCSQCCHGIFPVSQQDAARLRQGLTLLTAADPARAHRIGTRIASLLPRLLPHFPGDPSTGILHQDYESSPLFEDLLDSIAEDEPCPVLDPGTGTCDLYAHRPILCRTFGPPMRTAEDNLATCELCFTHASTEEVAACELDPNLPKLQQQSDQAFNLQNNTQGETVIALALRSVAPPSDAELLFPENLSS